MGEIDATLAFLMDDSFGDPPSRMVRPACAAYEKCRGYGCYDDPQDSGSGREVYCDCQAGIELQRHDTLSDISETELSFELGYEGDC